MIRRVNRRRQEHGYPVLQDGEVTTAGNEERAEMMAKPFIKSHGLNNTSEEGKRAKRKNHRIEKRVIRRRGRWN